MFIIPLALTMTQSSSIINAEPHAQQIEGTVRMCLCCGMCASVFQGQINYLLTLPVHLHCLIQIALIGLARHGRPRCHNCTGL